MACIDSFLTRPTKDNYFNIISAVLEHVKASTLAFRSPFRVCHKRFWKGRGWF